MRTRAALALLVLGFLVGPVPVGLSRTLQIADPAAWSSGGPEGSRIIDVAVDPNDPNTIFAVSLGSAYVYRTTDGGATWTPSDSGIRIRHGCFVRTVAIDPVDSRRMYAGTCGSGLLFRSTDAGLNWFTTEGQPWPHLGEIPSIAIDPAHPQTIYASTSGGVYRSTDFGETWTQPGTPNVAPFALLVDPINTRVLYAGAWDGVYRSTDSGATWTKLRGGLGRHSISSLIMDPIDSQVLYAGGHHQALYRTDDGGETWESLRENLMAAGLKNSIVQAIAVDPADHDALYVGTPDGILASSDGGDHWRSLETGYGLQVNDLTFDVGYRSIIVAGTEAGLFTSSDAGEHWAPSNGGISGFTVGSLAIDPDDGRFLWAMVYPGALFRSADRGTSWTITEFRGGVGAIAIDPAVPMTLYAAVNRAGPGRGIYRSRDRGVTWRKVGLSGRSISAIAVDPSDPKTLYAGSSFRGVFRSVDGGRSWRHLYGNKVKVRALTVDLLGRVFVGTESHGVLFSADRGATWLRRYVPGRVSDFAFAPDGVVYVAAAGVFESVDGSSPFRPVGLSDRGISSLVVDPTIPRRLFAGTKGGVFQSLDGGRRWRLIDARPRLSYITTLEIDPEGDVLHAGTYFDGVYEIDLPVNGA